MHFRSSSSSSSPARPFNQDRSQQSFLHPHKTTSTIHMRFLHAIIALLLPVGLGNCHASEDIDKRPPNIIVIMMGDIGRDWLSCYGSNHDTPNIDRLAENGLKYRTAWSAPKSTPACVSLLTGMYPFHHGWTRHYDVPRLGGDGLKPNRFTTFASILRDSGYSTGIAGPIVVLM